MDTRTAQLNITGMSCANCSATVGEALEGLDGVVEANVNYATDEGSVEYDPETVSLADIYDAVEDAGYGVVSETVSIAISDMSCANCADANEEALEGVPGVVDAEVNYATDEAQVTYNPEDASREAMYDAIEDAGYTPVREDGDEDDDGESARDAARNEEIRKQRRLTIFGAALSLPLLVFMVDHLFELGLVGDELFGLPSGWVAFALATPVQVMLGKPFYENSYKALVTNGRANMDVSSTRTGTSRRSRSKTSRWATG